MPENFDTEQAKITALETKAEKEEKAKELAAKLKQNRETFFGAVDSAEKDLAEGKSFLKDANSRNALTVLGDDIQNYLQQVAGAGEYIYRSKDTRGLEKIHAGAGKINDRVKEIRDGLPILKACEYAEYQERLARKNFLDVAETVRQSGKFGGEKLTPERKREVLVMLADKAIDELAPAKKQLTQNSSVPEMFSAYYTPVMESVNAALEDAGKLKLYYEAQDFTKKEEYSKYFIFQEGTGEVQVTEEFNKLPEEEQNRLMFELHALRMKVADEIGEKCATTEEEKKFFYGKQKMAAGETVFAKKNFIDYIKSLEGKAGITPEEEGRLKESREYLRQMGKLEMAMARQKLNLMRSSLEGRFTKLTSPGNYDVSVHHSVAKINMGHMEQVLKMAEARIEDGRALSIEEAMEQLRATDPKTLSVYRKDEKFALKNWQSGFEQKGEKHEIFDVLKAQCEISKETDPKKREEKILAYAKQARKLGLPDLAIHYYDRYFAPEISAKAKKINKAEFTEKMRTEGNLQEQVSEQMKLLKPKIEEYLRLNWQHLYFPEGMTHARRKELEEQGITFEGELKKLMAQQEAKAFNILLDEAYMQALKTEVHRDYYTDMPISPNSTGRRKRKYEWNEAYGMAFVNLETFDKKWYQKWKFTDKEWNRAKVMLIIDMATMLSIAAKPATLAARALVGEAVINRLLAKGVTEIAISEAGKKGMFNVAKLVVRELGFKEAFTYGLGHFIVDNGVYTVLKGALDEVYKEGSTVYTNPGEFFKKFGMNCLLTAPMWGLAGAKLAPGATKTAFAKVGKQLEQVKDSLNLQQIMALTFRARSGKEITVEEFKRIIFQNVIF